MNRPRIALQSNNAVAETLFITLYARALEAKFPAPLMRDDMVLALFEQIDYDFSRLKLQSHDQTGIILRLREFDSRTREFLGRCHNAVVVHIGCGLDTRFERVDNGKVEWYDLDLPEVMDLRRKLIGEVPRYHTLGCSMFDSEWLEIVGLHVDSSFLLLAEGVFPYFDETQVKGLVLNLRNRFPGAELVCDAMTPLMVRLHNMELSFSKLSARLRWGLRNGRDLEAWGAGICLLDEWYYFDRPEPRLGAWQWIRYVPSVAKGAGVFHYRLGRRAEDKA